MGNPLIIYLDSQDFSNLATPPKGREALFNDLRTALLKLLDAGAIEIRYSAIHISEIAHTKAEAAQYSAPRADMLKTLSRGKCMRFWSDISDDEIIANFDPAHPIQTTDDHDIWLDPNMKSLGNFVEKAKAALSEAMTEKGASRKERRRAAKADVKKFLLHTEKGRAVVDGIVENLNRDYGLTGTIDRSILEEYIAGSKDRSRFEAYVRGMLFDPVNLIAKLGPNINIETKLPKLVRDIGQSMVDSFNPHIDKLRNALTDMPKTEQYEGLRAQVRDMPRTIMRGVRRRMIRETIEENLELPQGLSDDQIDTLKAPVMDVYYDLLRLYISQTISAAEAGAPARYFRASDAADMFHALYIPHVDIFRCDSAWTNMLIPQGQRFSTEIVGKIEDLTPAIKRRMT